MAPLLYFRQKRGVAASQRTKPFQKTLRPCGFVADSQQYEQRPGCLCVQFSLDELFNIPKRFRFRGTPEQFRRLVRLPPGVRKARQTTEPHDPLWN